MEISEQFNWRIYLSPGLNLFMFMIYPPYVIILIWDFFISVQDHSWHVNLSPTGNLASTEVNVISSEA